jgi:sphingomyelin phosphodiesterase
VGGINPSWRVFDIDPKSHQVVDFSQHHIDLNQTYHSNASAPLHEMYYRASESYNLTDLSPASWNSLAQSFESNDALFQLYYTHFYTGTDRPPCEGDCKESQLCSIFASSSGLYKNCTKVQPEPSLC